MPEPFLRMKFTANDDAPFIVMFEPSGMTYDLAASEHMFAEVPSAHANEMEIVYWQGGISIWAPGSVVTYDADNNQLHELN